MKTRSLGLIAVALMVGAGSAQAQVAWDAPFLVPPAEERMAGLFLIEPAGGDIGAMIHVRPVRFAGRGGLGLRAGIAENELDDLSFFGGLDVSGTVLRRGDDVPVDADWVGGVGLGVGDEGVILTVPIGLTVGRTFSYEDNRITPYLIPKLAVDVFLGDEDDFDDFENDVDLEASIDLGIDFAWSERWMLRFGATLTDDRDGIAIGVVRR